MPEGEPDSLTQFSLDAFDRLERLPRVRAFAQTEERIAQGWQDLVQRVCRP